MSTIEEIKKILAEHKRELREEYKVKKIGVFGSYVRGEQNDESDLDVLVEFEAPVGFEFIHLADFLEQILGIKVDLTTPDGIKQNRWEYIKEDLIYVQARLESIR